MLKQALVVSVITASVAAASNCIVLLWYEAACHLAPCEPPAQPPMCSPYHVVTANEAVYEAIPDASGYDPLGAVAWCRSNWLVKNIFQQCIVQVNCDNMIPHNATGAPCPIRIN